MPQQSIFTEKKAPVPRIDPKGDIAYAALEQSRLSDLPYEEAQRELEALFDKNPVLKAYIDPSNSIAFFDALLTPQKP